MTSSVPQINVRILELIDKGYESGQIIDILREEQEQIELGEKEGNQQQEEEIFPETIQIISQAMASRQANESDIDEIYNVLRDAYSCETTGKEAFLAHSSVQAITKESISYLISSSSYRFIVLEVPNGCGIEKDGFIIGACCFSFDGESKKNGVIEGKLASVRFLGILSRYQHYCVGRRLLSKSEEESVQLGCCRQMICIASTRASLGIWLENRGYQFAKEMPYPSSLEHQLLRDDVQLLIYLKELGIQENYPKFVSKTTRMNLSPIWRMAAENEIESSHISSTSVREVD